MVKVIYYRVEFCDDNQSPPVARFPEFDTCQRYWDFVVDYMEDLSLNVFYGLLGLIAACMIGNVVMFYGFGIAVERMSKRVRDSAFSKLIRQEVAFFDLRSIGSITTRLSEDAALIHSFTSQPIRMSVMNASSVLVGLIVALFYMWPFA